jgi:hypothetical protein
MKSTPRRSSSEALRARDEQRRGDPGRASILVIQPELDDPPHLFGEWLIEAGATLDDGRYFHEGGVRKRETPELRR